MRQLAYDTEDWVVAAACRGRGDLFFGPDVAESRAARRRREEEAKAVCDGCVVKAECLTEALGSQERFGIWGGLTERERRAVRRSRTEDPPGGIADPGRPARLPAAVVQGRAMPHED